MYVSQSDALPGERSVMGYWAPAWAPEVRAIYSNLVNYPLQAGGGWGGNWSTGGCRGGGLIKLSLVANKHIVDGDLCCKRQISTVNV